MLRIMFKSWRMSFRTKRRFIVFCTAYAILIVWLALLLRNWLALGLDILHTTLIFYSLLAGAIMGITFAWWLAHGRRDDIAILKCIGWSNNNIRELVIGEIIFVTFAGLTIFALLVVAVTGLWFTSVISTQPFAIFGATTVDVPVFLQWWAIRPEYMWVSFLIVMVSQIPGILLLTWRILRISPMRALTRAE